MSITLSKTPEKEQEAIFANSWQKLTVWVSVHNQAKALPELHQTLRTVLQRFRYPFQLVYIDDGSTDTSWSLLKTYARDDHDIKVIKMRTTFGEASVMDAAMNVTDGDVIVFFTCRVGVNPADLFKLIQKLEQGYDLVVGQRSPRRDSRLNRFVSKFFNVITNRFTGLKLHDINSGVMAMRRVVLASVPFYGSLNAFLPVFAQRLGFKITETKVEQMPGRYNPSLYPRDYIRRLLDLISVLFLRNYTKKPLHFLGFLGALFTLAGAIINLYLFVYRLLGIGGIAGKPLLLLGAILFIVGIQMISIGLLGEMIIFTHAKNIKDYNIEEIIE
ncbi:glycosyltransferase [candidate division KSB1 bacterium]|nr:glycosyltransferase [candidate division KSB1 bacterium]